MKELGDLLLGVKGQGQVSLNQPAQRNQVAAEADEVLRPLMDLLDGNYTLVSYSALRSHIQEVVSLFKVNVLIIA